MGGDMGSEHNKQCIVAAWRAFTSRDAARIGACFTEDAQWLAPAGNGTAVGLGIPHHMVGRAQIARFIAEDVGKLFVADVQVDFRGLYAEGDVVILEERMQATLANGRPYDNDYCFIFELTDGRIRRVREYMDTHRSRLAVLG
jgi:ketosteroid isomerase-like protein